jgi:hypothetical protein
VDGLDIVRVIASPGTSHAPWADMVRNDIAVISELGAANATFTALGDDFFGEKFSHFPIRAEFSVSSGVLSILDSPNAQLPLCFRFWNRFPATAG